MKNLYAFFFVLISLAISTSTAVAAEGDTTVIQAQNEVHWDWNGNFYDTVQFPTGTYQKVIMHYVLGCPSIGCSGWDYTTNIQIWDQNTPTSKYELAKVITPYAGDKNQGWYHEYKFDVTHMLPVLQGQRVINARYDGWQDGFTISVYFEFIEGTPPRTPLQVDQVYIGGYPYGNASNPINTKLKEDTISRNASTSSAEFIMSATGHGFGNNNGNGVNPENCAEFCDKWYNVKVDGSVKYQQTVWRNDCGSEPLYAQTGTWVYDRAGWCPGSESQVFKHDISAFVGTGSDFKVKVDWQNYTATNVSMSYNISGQVVQYGPANHSLDAEVMDVLNPSNYDRYSRYNPTAKAPTIVVRNTGSTKVQSIKIKYGVAGGTFYTTTWNGDLDFLETHEVTLPIPEHNFFKGNGSNVFIAEILEVNGSMDEVISNNKYTSSFDNIDKYNGPFALNVKTNNRGFENWYLVTNVHGDTVLYRNNLASNTTYSDTLILDDGAYTVYIEDDGGDGLEWWANAAQGAGSMQMRNLGVVDFEPPVFIKTIPSDFGNFMMYNFSVGYDITQGNPNYDETAWAPPASVGIQKMQMVEAAGMFKAYPNPSSDIINVESILLDGRTSIKVFNQIGGIVYQSENAIAPGWIKTIDVKDWASGIYYITVSNNNKRETLKIVKQ